MPEATGRGQISVSLDDLKSGVRLKAGQAVVITIVKDVHVLSLQLQAIGGTNMVGETVQIIDPDTGEAVGDPITADASGNISAQVPDGKEYHLQVVHEDTDHLPADGHDVPDALSILVRFSDTDGNPRKGLTVSFASDGASVDLVTDDTGELHVPTTAGLATMTASGQTFKVHPVVLTDAADQSHYRFTVLS
jgi:hypothetical protein